MKSISKNNKLTIVALVAIPLIWGVGGYNYIVNNYSIGNTIVLKIKNGELINQDKTINVSQNQEITFRIISDTEEEFHLEGYHAFTSFKANTPTDISIKTLTPGEFPIILDKSGKYLATLRIISTSRE